MKKKRVGGSMAYNSSLIFAVSVLIVSS
jgi:hypothetical protein